MRLVGVPQVVGDGGEVSRADAQPFAGLVQPTTLDEPLGCEPEPSSGEPLEGALAEPELVAHLRDLSDRGGGLDVGDEVVDQLSLVVEGQEGADRRRLAPGCSMTPAAQPLPVSVVRDRPDWTP